MHSNIHEPFAADNFRWCALRHSYKNFTNKSATRSKESLKGRTRSFRPFVGCYRRVAATVALCAEEYNAHDRFVLLQRSWSACQAPSSPAISVGRSFDELGWVRQVETAKVPQVHSELPCSRVIVFVMARSERARQGQGPPGQDRNSNRVPCSPNTRAARRETITINEMAKRAARQFGCIPRSGPGKIARKFGRTCEVPLKPRETEGQTGRFL